MIKLTREYVEQVWKPIISLHLKAKGIFPYSNREGAKYLDIPSATFARIMSDLVISPNNEDKICKMLGVTTCSEWRKTNDYRSWIMENLANNYWLSYRFNSKRQLYVSSWIFKHQNDKLEVWKNAPKGYKFHGEMSIDESFCVTGRLSSPPLLLTYQTYFPQITSDHQINYNDNLRGEKKYIAFNNVIWNVLVKHGDHIYSTTEVLCKKDNKPYDHHVEKYIREKADTPIPFDPNSQFRPKNVEYLAYNFLTRDASKSRLTFLDRDYDPSVNLAYQHTIRVGCPVRSISNQTEFERVSKVAIAIKEVLIKSLLFDEENIFFELPKCTSYADTKVLPTYPFERSKTISYTHFVALIPKLQKQSIGLFAEIFYRIGRKLPVVVFFEDENSLPYVLNNLKENRHITNTVFEKIKLKDIPEVIKNHPEKILDYHIY